MPRSSLPVAAAFLMAITVTFAMPQIACAEGEGGPAPATRPARPPVSDQFGKAVALVIQPPNMWVDFDRGATTRPSAEVERRGNDAEFGLRWFRSQGIDGVVSDPLECIDVEAVSLSADDWGAMTPPQLVAKLAANQCLPVKMEGPIPVTYMDPKKLGTNTFGLRTREGSVIILQLDMPVQHGQWPVVRLRRAAPRTPDAK